MSIYDTLNKEQKLATMHTEGPVLILAGAGSGKTRVITHRIAYLMEECGVNPWNILAITFTNKAAGEMRERVDDMIGFGAQSVWISTFHAMCARILRRHIELMGYDQSFSIYDTDDQKAIMREVCKSLKIDTKTLRERTILSTISAAKNQLITPLKFRELHDSESFVERQIGEAYEEYQRRLRKNNALDFDDLLMLTVQLFQSHEEVLESYQNRFRYIMVDEYQDTNHAQFELVRLLAAKNRNLCVVGDDDQSIYKFRGADIGNILDFEKNYPDALVVRLEQNYRSTQNVLDAANGVIGHNARRKSKKLWTDRGTGEPIHFKQFASAREEASFVASDISRKIRNDRRLKFSDFAVLYRTNAQARLIEEMMVYESIPYNVVGGTNFYDRREIRDLIAYLKTIENGRDEVAVRRIINVPKRGIGQTSIGRVADYAASRDITFFEGIRMADDIPSLGRSAGKIKQFAGLIENLRSYAETSSLSDLMRELIREIDYEDYLRALDDEETDDRIGNVDELISKIADYEETAEEPTLEGFLEEVALIADIDNADDSDRVLLMTLHSAKGLEFPHVYITGMEEDIFPSGLAKAVGNSEEIEEERRLAYVGITRARDDLTLLCAQSRMLRGEVRYNPMSRFLLEIPQEVFEEGEAPGEANDTDSWADILGDSRGFERRGADGFRRQEYDGYRRKEYDGYRGTEMNGRRGKEQEISQRKRPKAVYRKPHTQEDKMPYIARASVGKGGNGLSSLQKGMPAAPVKPDYEVGDCVEHIKYGKGTVRKIEEGPRDYKVTVDFDENGTRIMYAAFAKLRKC